ncbi:hypothetical protein B0H14DRAFT_2574698 [Mycena olivaceomarginata]|nr:hypothetical protein B0H14DRAFT_2574698 [Mycena olivaceomarginata]
MFEGGIHACSSSRVGYMSRKRKQASSANSNNQSVVRHWAKNHSGGAARTEDAEDPRLISPVPSAEFDPMDVDPPPSPQNEDLQLPTRFVYVKHHAHSGKPPEIIPLESETPSRSPNEKLFQGSTDPSDDRPWAPFRCLADATFTYRCVSRRMPNNDVDEDLKHCGPNGQIMFTSHLKIIVKWRGLLLRRGRPMCKHHGIYALQFHTERISIDFQGREFSEKTYEIEIHFVILGRRPFWLDKGLVSTKVKMHPMLLRGCWIESATRNGSGNGGAALLGFVIWWPSVSLTAFPAGYAN